MQRGKNLTKYGRPINNRDRLMLACCKFDLRQRLIVAVLSASLTISGSVFQRVQWRRRLSHRTSFLSLDSIVRGVGRTQLTILKPIVSSSSNMTTVAFNGTNFPNSLLLPDHSYILLSKTVLSHADTLDRFQLYRLFRDYFIVRWRIQFVYVVNMKIMIALKQMVVRALISALYQVNQKNPPYDFCWYYSNAWEFLYEILHDC